MNRPTDTRQNHAMPDADENAVAGNSQSATEQARALLEKRRDELNADIERRSKGISQAQSFVKFAKHELIAVERMLRPAVTRKRVAKAGTSK